MSRYGNRSIGFLFGLLGSFLIVLEGFIDFVRSAFFLAIGHPLVALGAFTASVLFVVLGVVLAGFVFLGRAHRRERALASGVVLVVVALLGLLLLGFANTILGLLGAIFVLIAGLLYIIETR